jgi:hypothetical protein
MIRRKLLPAAERRALRLAAWGGGWGAEGYCDAMDVLPPNPPAEREAASQYHAAYQMGCEQRRGQRAAGGERG